MSNDDPKKSKSLNMDIKVDNLTVELCSDVIVTLTNLVPDFKTVLRFDDLFIKPSKLDLQKRMKYYAPLLYLRK
jgi:hypothetical protein